MLLRLNICAPVSGPLGLMAALEVLVSLDRLYLRTHPNARGIYESGVRYLRDADAGDQGTPPAELWLTIPDCIRAGGADCKVLAAWRCAELREQGEKTARCVLSHRGLLWHVRVQRGDGTTIEDPSKRLGMGGDV